MKSSRRQAGLTPGQWTHEVIARFWEWHSVNEKTEEFCFSRLAGKGIVNFLEATDRLRGNILDFGCGRGHLLTLLLKIRLECYGLDLSISAVNSVNKQFAQLPNWQGATIIDGLPTKLKSNFFDVITLIETFEHLTDDSVQPILQEIRRLLKPGGMFLLTTPFREDLNKSMNYCPFCDTKFHTWQHLRTVSPELLQAETEKAGLEASFIQALNFAQFQREFPLRPISELNLVKISGWLAYQYRSYWDQLAPRPFPKGRDFQWRLRAGHGSHLALLATKN